MALLAGKMERSGVVRVGTRYGVHMYRDSVGARFLPLAAAAIAVALVFQNAFCYGVVLDAGDGTGNTTAPEDDPGFGHVATTGSASSIYLGNRWLLTAAHVGGGPTTLGGTTYEPDPDSIHRLTNPDGLSEFTDLVLYQVIQNPELPSLLLGCETPAIGSNVLMIGRGRDREPEQSFWNVTRIQGSDNDTWEAVGPPPPPSDFSGFKTIGSQQIRWGTNIVTLNNFDAEDVGWGDVRSFQTTFDKETAALRTADEAQAVVGDSGGAVFQKNGSTWELVGVMLSVSLQENQPGGTTTAIFGNKTFIADVSQYAEQIHSIADFGPAPGDFDQDGELSSLDIDLLAAEIRAGGHACHFDLSGDGILDQSDFGLWLDNVKGAILGDADLNGEVAFADFVSLANNFNQSGGWAEGDFNGDAMVRIRGFRGASGKLRPICGTPVPGRRGAQFPSLPRSYRSPLRSSFLPPRDDGASKPGRLIHTPSRCSDHRLSRASRSVRVAAAQRFWESAVQQRLQTA